MPPPRSIASIPLAVSWSALGGVATPGVSDDSGLPGALGPAPVGSVPFPTVPEGYGPPIMSAPQTSTATFLPVSRLGLILSPATDPIPHRLVQRIRHGEFVEMRDLLADNISLFNHLEDFHGHSNGIRARLREVPSLASWVYCFAAFTAVLTSDPRTRDMLAYCRLIIREALRHGGNGWQEYDRTFRRQAAIDPHLPWHTLHPGLQAATVLSNRGTSSGTTCSICREPDHSVGQCALFGVQQPLLPPASSSSQFQRSRRVDQVCTSWNRGNCAFLGSCMY